MSNDLLLKTCTNPVISQLMSLILGQFVTIYMLHRPKSPTGAFDGTSPALLEQSINYAKNAGFYFASIDELVDDALAGKRQQQPTLCFTLDDGYQDQLDHLVPVLLKHNCKPTLFVIADMVNDKDWPWDAKLAYAIWNCPLPSIQIPIDGSTQKLQLDTAEHRINVRRKLTSYAKRLSSDNLAEFLSITLPALQVDLSNPPPEYQPASWESLRTAEQKGLKIGSHGCSHRVFSSLDDEKILFELDKAKTLLAQNLNNPSRVFCYPSGKATDFLDGHRHLLAKEGYIGALNSIAGNPNFEKIRTNPFNIHRHSFPSNLNTFIRYSSWLEYLRSKF